jgi:tetratricopeptide (TPR) repeat protein
MSLPASAQRWIKVPAPDFTIYTNAGDSRGRDVAVRLEQMRKIFPVLVPRPRWTVTAPLMVVAFRDHKDLLGVAPTYEGRPVDVGALFLRGGDRNFIVLDVNADNDWRPVYHEYAHFMLDANLPRTPLWFDEGFADYFSTVKFETERFSLGLPPPGYLEALEKPPALSLEQILNVTPFSPEYKSMMHGRGEFYARSWLLTHYVLSNKKLSQAMQYFDLTMNQRVPVSEAVQQAFGMTLKELSEAVKEHRTRSQQFVQSYATPVIEKLSFSIEILKEPAISTLLADVHLHSPDHQAQAENEFRQLIDKEGEKTNVAAHAGLGYVWLRKGDMARAKREFTIALDAGSDDTRVWYLAAYTDYKQKPLKDRDSSELIELNTRLDGALQRDPNDPEAMYLKALVLSSAANPAEAIRLLRRACELRSRNEAFKLELAHQYVRARKFEEAQAVLERLKRSQDPAVVAAAEKQSADAKLFQESKLAQYIEESKNDSYVSPQWRAKPGQKVDPDLEKLEARSEKKDEEAQDDRPIKFGRGVLLSSSCPADGSVKMKVKFPTKIMDVSAPAKDKVVVIGAGSFDCTWKERRVAINYRARSAFLADLVSIEIK